MLRPAMPAARNRATCRLPLAAEVLESRWLLSSVAVNLSGDSLSLVGDDGNHSAMVFVVGDHLHFHGENGTEFTFEGTTSTDLDIPLSRLGSLHNIFIVAQGGDDRFDLDLTGLAPLAGGITVALGAGENAFVLRDAVARHGVWYAGGQATDQVLIERCTLGGLVIATMAGNDTVTVSSCHFEAQTLKRLFETLQVGPHLNLLAGPGVGANLLAGLGLPPLPPPPAPPNPGLPDLALFGGDMAIDTSSGDDTVVIENVTGAKPFLGGNWSVRLGEGNDTLHVDGSTAKNALLVDAGSGNDAVALNSSTLEGVTAVAGSWGADRVSLASVNAAGPVFVGTLGADSQVELDDSRFQGVVGVTMLGERSGLLVETSAGNPPTAGTTFDMPVLAVLPGKDSVVHLGSPAPGDPLQFASFLTVVGGAPALPVHVAVNTAIDANKLLLVLAERHNA